MLASSIVLQKELPKQVRINSRADTELGHLRHPGKANNAVYAGAVEVAGAGGTTTPTSGNGKDGHVPQVANPEDGRDYPTLFGDGGIWGSQAATPMR
jgi:hypothetical protein